eukprot:Nitzschia sp. Nitz4//scaffold61_size107673//3835//4793//NITZ4_004218-RA/size107673-augustus-gene-0.212-mRNA-1//-1//CDS//3329555659//5890//frame0
MRYYSPGVPRRTDQSLLCANNTFATSAMADNTPLSTIDPTTTGQADTLDLPALSRQRSKDMVDEMHHHIVDEDPLLISQTLTYVTDDGSIVHSFHSAPFSFGFKARFAAMESIFALLLIFAVPIGAHGIVLTVSVVNLLAVAWFWYNYVRSVEVTSDGNLRFWIGNIEIDVPFDKVVSIRRVATTASLCSCFFSIWPYRGFLSSPSDGVAIVTTVPSTPFWLWPRSAGKPERSFLFGLIVCPKLTVVFSPAGGGHAFVTDVENEMRNFANGTSKPRTGSALPPRNNPDFLDV